MAARSSSRTITDHEEIRQWAEEREARPSCVRGTGSGEDIGMLRLDFPGYSGEDSLEEISWDDWLDKFDERGLALLVQDTTARGERSNFNKLVSRGAAAGRKQSRGTRSTTRARSAGRKSASARSTATSSRGRKSSGAKKTTARKSATSGTRRDTGRKAAGKKSSSRSAKVVPIRGSSRAKRTSTTRAQNKTRRNHRRAA